MADTMQVVLWSLAQTCKLRPTGNSVCCENSRDILDYARTYSEGLTKQRSARGVFGDIYVSEYTYGYNPVTEDRLSKSKYPCYPSDGFVISETFKNVSDPASFFEMCRNCSANVTPNELAGCYGTLFQYPDSDETENQIRRIIDRLGLKKEMQSAFPNTNPIWYGLWAITPVPAHSLPFLHTIILEIHIEDRQDMETNKKIDRSQLCDFNLFLNALKIAEQQQLPLNVLLTPPGHTDFGIYTVFPHCPFCKAATRTARWQRKYPTALYTCHVCGRVYSPATTAHHQKMKMGMELREILGHNRFIEFAKEHLITLGETPKNAELIVQETEIQNERREAQLRENRERNKKKQAYLVKHIFAGVQSVSPPQREEIDEESFNKSDYWFSGEVLTEILSRCKMHDIKVSAMIHDSIDGKTDRCLLGNPSIQNPLEILRQWRKEGCNGKYNVNCIVPDRLVL